MIAEGFSYRDLADMPLEVWTDFYLAAEHRRIDRQLTLLGLLHPKDPNDTRQQLLRAQEQLTRARRPEPPDPMDPFGMLRNLGALVQQGKIGIIGTPPEGMRLP